MSQIETLDWSAEEAILNPARHQKEFSSCWAMAACAATEAALAIRDKYEPDPLKLLSPQHLINNVSKYFPYVEMDRDEYGCYTCNVERAFLYMMSEGIPAGDDCIYEGGEGDCSMSHLGAEKFYIHSFGRIACDDEEALIARVIQQPVVATIVLTRGFARLRSEVYMGKPAAAWPDDDNNDDKDEVNNDNEDEDGGNFDDDDEEDDEGDEDGEEGDVEEDEDDEDSDDFYDINDEGEDSFDYNNDEEGDNSDDNNDRENDNDEDWDNFDYNNDNESDNYEDRHNLDDEDNVRYRDWGIFVEVPHSIVIVGFGYDDETKVRYWKVINSYGPGWGENGFGRVCMNSCRPQGTENILYGFRYPIV